MSISCYCLKLHNLPTAHGLIWIGEVRLITTACLVKMLLAKTLLNSKPHSNTLLLLFVPLKEIGENRKSSMLVCSSEFSMQLALCGDTPTDWLSQAFPTLPRMRCIASGAAQAQRSHSLKYRSKQSLYFRKGLGTWLFNYTFITASLT